MEYLPLLAEEGGWLRRCPTGPPAASTGGTAPTTASLPSSGESFSSLGDLLDVEVPCAPSEAALYAELLVERPINLNRTSPGQINAHAPAESAAENWS